MLGGWLRDSRRDTVCSGNTPPKRPHTAHESRKRAEQCFARPYGKAYGLFVDLAEYSTVRHGRSKSGGVLGVAEPQGGSHRRPTIEALRPYAGLAGRLVITNCLEERDPAAGCVRRSLCAQNRGFFSTASPKAVLKTHW